MKQEDFGGTDSPLSDDPNTSVAVHSALDQRIPLDYVELFAGGFRVSFVLGSPNFINAESDVLDDLVEPSQLP